MKELSRKERERLRRRELIIDVAEEVIHQHGFKSSTMEQIAEGAELGKGTLYLHFKSKVSIYLAICDRGSKKLNRELAKVLATELSGLEMVREIGYTYLRFIQKNPLYFSAFNYYENILDDDKYNDSPMIKVCEENAREAMTYIVRAMQIGIQDGSIDGGINPKELGLVMWGASKGVVHVALLKNKRRHMAILDDVEFSFDSLMESFIQLMSSGIKNDRQSEKV
ncbi:TetR/AcrR family transcriptional regulator [Rhodohalobacter halophilus]|uniref:TetR/AcrR family transcriptional regulator n=1 Tax=Rhodohalobacter halophilus TaxID=1812810 RepID=UPI00083F8167|nr:TetR/AcrR family transcriptional regulator [Rhodohalobacter halophilus]